jgi:hypothetical protein
MASKTYYDTLGVSQAATSEQIREAYLVRSKMFHPDRFDQSRQATEWCLANEMLKELNQAYNVLRDPRSRSAYDSTLKAAQPPPIQRTNRPAPSPQEQKRQPPSDLGILSSGFARFSDLPQSSRDKLTQRASRKNNQQYITSLQGVGWNYFFLLLFLCWYVFIFVLAQNERWTSDGRNWIWGISAVSALLVGTNLSWIVRWHKSPLRCNFIVSPLYFIKTHLDQVWFWPLWQLKDVSATHNYRNGSFTGTDVRFVFDTGPENLSFPQRDAYEQVISAARVFDAKLRSAKQQGQWDYFLGEDDFRGWTPGSHSKPRRSPSMSTIVSVACSLGTAALITLIAIEVNTSTFPYKPPSKFSTVQPVTPSRPAYVPPPRPTFAEPELTIPSSGEVRSYTTQSGVAPLQIRSSSGSNYLVKLDDATTGKPVLSVFVRGGQTEEIDVPLGTYVVKYASGDRWYGYTHLFGPDTQYSKADRNFTFSFDGSQYSGYTVTLYKVRDGNLSTSSIAADDF